MAITPEEASEFVFHSPQPTHLYFSDVGSLNLETGEFEGDATESAKALWEAWGYLLEEMIENKAKQLNETK